MRLEAASHADRTPAQDLETAQQHTYELSISRLSRATRHWPFPKARGNNMEHYILPLGMANRMRSRMRMDSQSQSHALSRGGCVLQRSCLSS